MSIWLLVIIALSILTVKLYFRGGQCNIRRNLTGMVAVITGGSSGVGKQTLRELARYNCHVFIGSRDRIKCENVIQEIKTQANNPHLHYIQLDLADKQSIELFAREVKRRTNYVDFLINNAGMLRGGHLPQAFTKQGWEVHFAANYLGHFYLTYLLWEHLKSSAESRIINVSAPAERIHKKARIDFDDLFVTKDYTFSKAYSRSKYAQILFTNQLARRLGNKEQCQIFSVYPGVCRTQISRSLGRYARLFQKILAPMMWIFMKSSKSGAQTTLFLVMQDKPKLTDGGYYADCAETPSESVLDSQSSKKLWSKSQQLLGISFAPSK